VSNRFFLFVGIFATFISVIVIILLSKTISRPIMELSGISERMSELDFDAKYQPKKHSSRELEDLGSHMNKLSETLEATISELKAANNELQKDIQKKEQIDEMRREFLSNVSHELKTPLALISGYAEGLREGVNDSEESRNFYCEVITDESEKMNRMVNKLLTLNQLEFGNEKVEMVRFDITELIRGVIASSSLLAQQSGIEIIFEEEKPTYVWGDEFKIEEVVTNFLSNALHYAEGEKKIRIFYAFHDNLLRVSVFNTGKPIPEEDIDKIWIKFYKVDKARTREYGGSGIGLSIVKAIMDSLHRECGVINHSDGVEFWMELESELHIDNVSKIW
jgi:signal transduction histidine kinase